jgi:hypothetical protein
VVRGALVVSDGAARERPPISALFDGAGGACRSGGWGDAIFKTVAWWWGRLTG